MAETDHAVIAGQFAVAAVVLLVSGLPLRADAHPMPDTRIDIARTADQIDLTLRLPLEDLRLAMPARTLDMDDRLSATELASLRTYFAEHVHLTKSTGRTVPVTIAKMAVSSSGHENVGLYQELEVHGSARIGDPGPVTLAYDAIMHRVANHRAHVIDGTGKPLGTIRYSLSEKATNLVTLPAIQPGSTNLAEARAVMAPRSSRSARFAIIFSLILFAAAVAVWTVRRLRAADPSE